MEQSQLEKYLKFSPHLVRKRLGEFNEWYSELLDDPKKLYLELRLLPLFTSLPLPSNLSGTFQESGIAKLKEDFPTIEFHDPILKAYLLYLYLKPSLKNEAKFGYFSALPKNIYLYRRSDMPYVETLLATGWGNCLSFSILYIIIAYHLGLDARLLLLPPPDNHAIAVLYISGRKIIVDVAGAFFADQLSAEYIRFGHRYERGTEANITSFINYINSNIQRTLSIPGLQKLLLKHKGEAAATIATSVPYVFHYCSMQAAAKVVKLLLTYDESKEVGDIAHWFTYLVFYKRSERILMELIDVLGSYDIKAAHSITGRIVTVSLEAESEKEVLEVIEAFRSSSFKKTLGHLEPEIASEVGTELGRILDDTKSNEVAAEAAKAIGNYDGATAQTIAYQLRRIASEKRLRESSVGAAEAVLAAAEAFSNNRVIDVIKKYRDALDDTGVHSLTDILADIAIETKSSEQIVNFAVVVGNDSVFKLISKSGRYFAEPHFGLGFLHNFWRIVQYSRSTKVITEGVNAFNDEKVLFFIKKFRESTLILIYCFDRIVGYTHSSKPVLELVSAFKEYPEPIAVDICSKLAEIAAVTKSAGSLIALIKSLDDRDANLANSIVGWLKVIANSTKSGKVIFASAKLLGNYRGDIADDIARRLADVASKSKSESTVMGEIEALSPVVPTLNLSPFPLSTEKYKEIIKNWSQITRYISFQKIRLDDLKKIIKAQLRREFHVIEEISEKNECGFACSSKLGNRGFVFLVNILRDKKYAIVNHVIITIYLKESSDIEDILESLVLIFINAIEKVSNQKMMPPTHIEQKSVIISIRDSIVYRAWFGDLDEVKKQIIDSIIQ